MKSPLLNTWQNMCDYFTEEGEKMEIDGHKIEDLTYEFKPKPLTDEEFEQMKIDRANKIPMFKVGIERLIATVDYWRRERQQTAKDSVSVIDRLQKENADLKGGFTHGYAKGIKMNPNEDEWIALEEENAKLRKEKETSMYDYSDLRREADRLIKVCEILANKEPIDVGSNTYNKIMGQTNA